MSQRPRQGDAVAFSVVAPPAHGTIKGAGADLTYTPKADFNGADNFTFKVNDGSFPRSIVNVGAHSDSRGTHEYNMMLSKKRAGSTRDYLLSRGIGRSRIHLSWFGEELVLNRCSDGVECPEEEHSRNRRGE